MDQELAIQVTNLSKVYKLYDNPVDRLKESLHPFRKKYHRDFYALKDISFEVERGESIGIIGKNGSGKSTLLKLLTGVLTPTSGEVSVNGRIAALLELGTGFNPEMTGIENIYFSGTLHGYTREEIDDRLDGICSFADIGDFIRQPVKTYSSGMFVRLAFANAISVNPDILIVDEALSVGDIFFQQKCHARMEELVNNGTTIIVVSHATDTILKYSTRTMLLDEGACLLFGQPNEAVHRYYALLNQRRRGVTSRNDSRDRFDGQSGQDTTDKEIRDWPSKGSFLDTSNAVVTGQTGIARCTCVALCNEQGVPCEVFRVGDNAIFFYEFEFLEDIEVPLGGVNLTNSMNIVVHSKGSFHHLVHAPDRVRKGERVRFRQTMKLRLALGEYTFTIALSSTNATDYSQFANMHHEELHTKLNDIIRIGRIGKFSIVEKSSGIRLPFYGYVDLDGDVKCALIR